VRCSGSTVAGELILVDRQGRAPVRWDVLSGRFTVWLWLRTTGAWSLAADFVGRWPRLSWLTGRGLAAGRGCDLR
jgi:hypothetical protein